MNVGGAGMATRPRDDLLVDIERYLRAHHTMTIATRDPVSEHPHAAHVFYAVDEGLRLVFLSRLTSLHGKHIGKESRVAATVSEEYQDWQLIKGVQIWGTACLLRGKAKTGALALYLKQFPFVSELISSPGSLHGLRGIGVYRLEPDGLGLTDNTAGVFGRETLDLDGD